MKLQNKKDQLKTNKKELTKIGQEIRHLKSHQNSLQNQIGYISNY